MDRFKTKHQMPLKKDVKITGFTVRDIRFPCSLSGVGSDPMNSAGEQSLGHITYQTDSGLVGNGFSFANGQGTEILCAALKALAPRFVGRQLSSLISNFAKTHRDLLSGQIRFISPERGIMQLAYCAILNSIWDLWAKVEEKPLWRLVSDMTPEQIVSCIDFRYITDVVTPDEAIEMLKKIEKDKQGRIDLALKDEAVPGYNTSVGWLGYSDEKVSGLVQEAKEQGFNTFKLKVGIDLDSDRKRLGLIRKLVGPDAVIMTDCNQIWDVDFAIEYMPKLKDFNLLFIEEPTSPDDVLGHAKIRKALKEHGIGVATGEHVNNRVMFKQLLQAEAIDALQLDAMRLSGMNEILSVMIMAAKFGVPVVPHAGGVGMTELCSHISHIDFVAISGKKSILEYTDHLHEVFTAPAGWSGKGHHTCPTVPGYSSDIKEQYFTEFEFPNGTFWKSEVGQRLANDPWRGVPGEQTS